jgi:hypothetical protein
MLCSRQSGKSLCAAAVALREALLRPPALILILSPSGRQSKEFFKDKFLRLYKSLGRPVGAVQESSVEMELANGSRVVALPGDEDTIVGYSGVRLLVVDEAARVPDSLYYYVRPMLAVSRGMLVVLSTPKGRRGWFYEEWTNPKSAESWERAEIPATMCPRISPEFLAKERGEIGEFMYTQEYLLHFNDLIGSLFNKTDIDAALAADVRPLDLGG